MEIPSGDTGPTGVDVRPYLRADRPALWSYMLTAQPEEFGLHAELVRRYPRVKAYFADGLSHYYDLEPESCFVADAAGRIVGNLFGSVSTTLAEKRFRAATERRIPITGNVET